VLGAALVGIDTGARLVAQDQLAHRAQTATGAQGASAGISGFPFLFHLLVQGSVSGIDLHLTGVAAGRLQLDHIEVQLVDTTIDRGALFHARQVHVKSISAATATVTVTAAELSSAVGDPVSLPGNGQVLVDVAGRMVPATVQIVGGHLLTVSVGGVGLLSSDLTSNPFVPACGLTLVIGSGQLAVSCHVQPVPAALIQAIAGS